MHGLYHAYQAEGASTNYQLKDVARSVISSTLNPDAVGAGVYDTWKSYESVMESSSTHAIVTVPPSPFRAAIFQFSVFD